MSESRAADLLVLLRLWISERSARWRLSRTMRDPMRVQCALLMQIIRDNRQTGFGGSHGFDQIADYSSFASRVPVSDYEDLRPFIESQIQTGENALTAEAPRRYVRTSGTTGAPKDIPITGSHFKMLRRAHRDAVAFQYRNFPDAFEGTLLTLVSPSSEGALANGKPFGSASGLVAASTPGAVREKFVVPRAVFGIADSRLKYLLILRLAIARRDVTLVGTANPTTMLALLRLYHEHQSELVSDVRCGTFFLGERVPEKVWNAVRARLRADPLRADDLGELQSRSRPPTLADIWPSLRLVVTWTCASAGIAADALRRELPSRGRIMELGYLSSEFRGTVTIGRRSQSGLPTLDTHFFEFIDPGEWDEGRRSFLTMDQVRKGRRYYVVVTTPSGLYRYFINDIVRVTGRLHGTPLLQFLQKGKGVTNITGEKLYEAQVLQAVRETLVARGSSARFVMMLADEEDVVYHLYVEADHELAMTADQLGSDIDARLASLNIEYRSKRESSRLKKLRAHWLRRGTGEAYRLHCIHQGQREGQFKMVSLDYRRRFSFDLDAHLA